MNQEKIGKFIAKLRKENNMTQQELADKLGITDRAISKWENGRGLPDLSLIKPLCEELSVSINELLAGERLNEEEYKEAVEENIITTIDYADKKLKKNKRIFTVIVLVIVFLIMCFITMFVVDVHRMRENRRVVFSTWGFDYAPAVDLHEAEIEQSIIKYLQTMAESEPVYFENAKSFVSMRIYLLEEVARDTKYNVYAWVLEESYYMEDSKIKKDSAASVPHKFVVENIEGVFTVTDSRTPRDGSYYAEDMKNIFPGSVISDMEDVSRDGTITRLSDDITRQVNLYFNKEN